MALKLNAADAKKADNFSSIIRDAGSYVGTITRAEKLLSKNNVQGVGLSFKTDNGESASYLDVYTAKANGELLRGHNIIQALMCCVRVKDAADGRITFERWNAGEHRMVQASADGYPALMGKRIGMVFQIERQTHSVTGEDVDRLSIVTVFEASSRLTASEILDGKTKPERLAVIERMVAAKPVRDSRNRSTARPAAHADADFDDDIPF